MRLREFIVAFFTIAFAASLPNLIVGILSALQGVPELSFGDVISGNVIDLTLAVALAILISRASIDTGSKLVQKSALFTAAIAVLPLFLIFDGKLGRGDGLVLILAFIIYVFWLFSKEDRFSKVYDEEISISFSRFLKDMGIILLSLVAILVAAQGIVKTAVVFADLLRLPLILVGILIVSLGNAMPETYFAIVSARREQNWMVLGDLMGSIIGCTTFVLGTVALIHPITIASLPAVIVARFFLIISAIFFLSFIWTGRKVTKREASFLFFLYVFFILIELLLV